MNKKGRRFPQVRSALLQLKRLYGTETEIEKQSLGCEYVFGKIGCCKYLGERREDSGRRAGNLTEMKVDSIRTQL